MWISEDVSCNYYVTDDLPELQVFISILFIRNFIERICWQIP